MNESREKAAQKRRLNNRQDPHGSEKSLGPDSWRGEASKHISIEKNPEKGVALAIGQISTGQINIQVLTSKAENQASNESIAM